MTDMNDRLICVELATPDIKIMDSFLEKARLLRETHVYGTRQVLAFVHDAEQVDPALRNHFDDIKPQGGFVTLELAVELSGFLPNPDCFSEFIIASSFDRNKPPLQLCFSNRMASYSWIENGKQFYTIVARTAGSHGAVQVRRDSGEYSAIETLMKTMVCARFRIGGDTAADALERNVRRCMEELFAATNHCIDCFREVVGSPYAVPRKLSDNSVNQVFLLVFNHEKAGSIRLALGAGGVMLVPGDVSAEDAEKISKLAGDSSSISIEATLISSAWTSWHTGDYRFVLLDAVIAAEVVTERVVRDYCLAAGISVTTLRDQRDSMTYSWSLNVGLRLWRHATGQGPSDEQIAKINFARKLRNDLMHRGEFSLNREGAKQVLQDTEAFLAVLRAKDTLETKPI